MFTPVSAPKLSTHVNALTEVGNVIEPGDSRWADGVIFNSVGCEVIFGHDAGCWTPRGDKLLQDGCSQTNLHSWVLELSVTWPTIDANFDPKSAVVDAMEVGTSAVLERLLELGSVDVPEGTDMTVPSVVGPISTTGITGRAVDDNPDNLPLVDALEVGPAAEAATALGAVEAKLLDASDHIGSRGTIYMNPQVFTSLSSGFRDVDSSGHLVTPATGSHVVIGNFANQTIYGHVGGVDVYLGPIDLLEEHAHGTNEMLIQAERFAAVVRNTCATFKNDVADAAAP